MSVGDAFEKLKSAGHRLTIYQDQPPIAFVKALSDRISGPRVFGPAIWSKPEYVRKLRSYLLQSGRNQTLIDGHSVSWLSGVLEFRTWTFCKLLGLEGHDARLARDLFELRDAYVHRYPRNHFTTHVPSEQEQRRDRLMNRQRIGSNFSWSQLPQDEFEFACAVERMRDTIWSLAVSGVQDGRFICVEHVRNADRLMSTDNLERVLSEKHPKFEVSILPTGELNEQWLVHTLGTPRASKKAVVRRAVVLMENIYEWTEANGRRASKDDVLLVIRKQFKISDEAVHEAWMLAKLPNWHKSGRIPANLKISDNEINDIINRGEVQVPFPDYFG